MKYIYTTVFLLLTVICYGQKSSLLQNVNSRAKELKHHLNKSGDSLILSSDKIIEKVEIYNSKFGMKFMIFNHKARIPLLEMPSGRYVTEVKLRGKLILITLLIEENHKAQPLKVSNKRNTRDKLEETHDLFGNKKERLAKKTKPKKIIEPQSVKSIKTPIEVLNKKINPPKKESHPGKVRFYWIVRNVNKGSSSSKQMRIGERDVVDRMIAQNKIDLRSKAGKNNKLTIWEVYDTSAFMKFKRLNPDYANVEEADCFNTKPYYKS